MESSKVRKFMSLGGQEVSQSFSPHSEAQRRLGAQLLLSEVLEYVIHGLGVVPEFEGKKITSPDDLHYHSAEAPDVTEMLDGLADVAYTMYWNALAFGLPLEKAFDMVCDNNLEKFVRLGEWARGRQELGPSEWDCRVDVHWPNEVVRVDVIDYRGELYAVGKDARGKVRKPSSYSPVDLSALCVENNSQAVMRS